MRQPELNLMEVIETIGRNFRKKRINVKNGKTDTKIETVSKAVKIDVGTLSKIETGDYPSLKLDQIIKLASYWNMSLDEVFGLEAKQMFYHSQVNTDRPIMHNNFAEGWKVHVDYLQSELDKVKEENQTLRDRLYSK